MVQLPETGLSLIVRTHFSNDSAWTEIRTAIETPTSEGFVAGVEFVNDPAFDGWDATALKASLPGEFASVLFAADETSIVHPEHPLLAIDLLDFDGEIQDPFRAIPATVHAIEANLNLANLDWADFAENVDEDGIYRTV